MMGRSQPPTYTTGMRSGTTPGRLRLALAVLLVLVTGGPAVIAENSDRSISSFWNSPEPGSEQQSTPSPSVRLVRPKHHPRTPAAALAAPAPAPAQPAVPPSFFVTVLGDNLALPLAQGLQEALADKPEIAVSRKLKEGSGLVRDDFYDWNKATSELLGSKEKIDVAVIILGSNDAQSLHDAAGSYDVRTDKWKEIYAKRVDDIANQLKNKKIPLIWVGVPVMRSDKLSSVMAYINDIYREEAAKTGATFVDTWGGFVDEDGQYSDYGPDFSGQRARLRTSDGVHFTRAGARKLASFVENDIRRMLDNAKPAVDLASVIQGATGSPANLPPEPTVDINTLIQRELAKPGPGQTAQPPQPNVEASLPPPAAPLAPVIPLKPAAGPIVPLTTAPLSPGGALVSAGQTAASGLPSDAAELLERALVEGKALDAKPGRADDFAWPRR